MLKLYDHPLSGNCYKVRLLLALSGVPYESIFVDVLARKNLTFAFASISPFQQVPVLQDGDDYVWDSQAILVHIATRHAENWLPAQTSIEYSHMLQWLSVTANEIGNSLQPMRLYHRFGVGEAAHHMGIAEESFDAKGCRERCQRLLSVLNDQLVDRRWLLGGAPSIADIACFPYVSLAQEAQSRLEDFEGVLRWAGRVAALPGFVPMT